MRLREGVREVIQVLNVIPGVALNEASTHAISLSTFGSESTPPRVRDHHVADLNRLAASSYALVVPRGEPGANETDQQPATEAVGEQQRPVDAVRAAGEQFERSTRFATDATFSRGPRHTSITLGKRQPCQNYRLRLLWERFPPHSHVGPARMLQARPTPSADRASRIPA
jgi:hypothetical protein